MPTLTFPTTAGASEMALSSALVDRARRVRNEATPRRVEGTTTFATVTGAWFKARLTVPAAPEADDAQGSHRRTVARPTLLLGVRDREGNRLEPGFLSADDKVEVDSRQFGRGVWEVTGDPEPLRKKRRVIGFQATLAKVDEDPYEAA